MNYVDNILKYLQYIPTVLLSYIDNIYELIAKCVKMSCTDNTNEIVILAKCYWTRVIP